jgi:putative oxygen-independent coproporphyrinogen III oxidase
MPSAIAPAPSRSSPAPASAAHEAASFGVYVHWPFCASKCPYCDFNSHVRAGGIDEARFLAAFLRELAHWSGLAPGRTVSSIFFGGGTPSLMSAATAGAILDAIGRHWRVEAGAEVTLEANPSSVEAARFRGYRAAGVNRVSLGVQSLEDAQLRALGRLHTAAEARAAIEVARATFDRFSFDLIYARPGQALETWRAELGEALALAGRHISLYQLTIEPGTPFADLHARGKLAVPDGERARAFYELTQELTERRGLPAYEISNHAAPGEESRHNLLYWRYGEYAGVGPGAHGRVVVDGVRRATSATRNPEAWAAQVEAGGQGIAEATSLGRAEEADEALLMGLRLTEGIDLSRLAALTGLAPKPAAVAGLVAQGLVERLGPDRVRASAAGRIVLDQVVLRMASALEPTGPKRPYEQALANDMAARRG